MQGKSSACRGFQMKYSILANSIFSHRINDLNPEIVIINLSQESILLSGWHVLIAS
jgi:hypothetical protein